MKILVLTPLLAAGCGPSATLADCVGALAGTYDGAMNGSIDAQLLDDGTLRVTFYNPDGSVAEEGSADVQDSGGLAGSAGDLDFTGLFDFDSCSATGDWLSSAATAGDGSWELSQ
jgi:hypothetical protein